jgi:hypothetical protein
MSRCNPLFGTWSQKATVQTRDGWRIGRDFHFIGKKKPRIAKNCKESETRLDNT